MPKKALSIGDHWRLAFFLLILAIMMIALFFSMPFGMTAFHVKQALADLDREQRQYFEIWRTQPLTFPADIMDVEPFAESTVAAAKSFRQQWTLHGDLATSLNLRIQQYYEGPGEAAELAALTTELEQLESLIEAFENLVAHPDYEIEALTAGYDPVLEGYSRRNPGLPFPNLRALRLMPNLMRVKISALLQESENDAAVAKIESILKAAKVNQYSMLVMRSVNVRLISIDVEIIHEVASSSDDPFLLRQILKRLNDAALQPNCSYHVTHPTFPDPDVALSITEHIGNIRYAKRFGIERNIQGMTAQAVRLEATIGVENEYREKVLIPGLENEARIRRLRRQIARSSYGSSALQGQLSEDDELLNKIIIPRIASAQYFTELSWPDYAEFKHRDNLAQSKYDLLRLTIAQKIFELEQGEEPAELGLLAPDLLPQIPVDPYSDEQPYRTKPFFYSIGPDGIDQQGALLYDPTNGSFSAGDIFLKN